MQKRRLVVHVGLPKCGSSFLQAALRNSAAFLQSQGVAYPHDGGPHPGNAADLADLSADALAALFGKARILILSHEDLLTRAGRHADFAATVRSMGISVRVVAFLRPFSEFVFGDYSQHMKQGFPAFLAERKAYRGMDFDAFAARRAERFRPAENLSDWAALFPDRPPILAPHRRIPQTIARIMPRVSFDWNVPRDQVNPSLRIVDCDRIAEAINDPAVPVAAVEAKLMRAWVRVHGQPNRLPDPGRSPERIAAVETMFAPQNAALLERFGYDNRAKPRQMDGRRE